MGEVQMKVYDSINKKLKDSDGNVLYGLRSVARAAGYKNIVDLAASMKMSRQWLYNLYNYDQMLLANTVTKHMESVIDI